MASSEKKDERAPGSLLPASCPDENTLAAYAEGALDEAARVALLVHLDACEECLAIVSDGQRTLDEGEAFVPDRSEIARGTALGKYVVVAMIGQGGMGTVYEAVDPALERRVALKVVRAEQSSDGGSSLRLLREARAMAKLSHPNVVTIYDVAEIDRRVVLAMELVEGMTLSAWLEEGRDRHDWREILAAFIAAGRGIIAAHEAGIIHRDFKPANVLIDESGRVLVTDFGLAVGPSLTRPRHAESSEESAVPASRQMTSGLVAGTPAFMSPEQLAGEALDVRSDVFSFAVALYRALYKHHPFEGVTSADLLASIEGGAPREPPRDAQIPRRVHRVIAKSLSCERDARHESMARLIEDLTYAAAPLGRRILHGSPHSTPAHRARRLAAVALIAFAGFSAVTTAVIAIVRNAEGRARDRGSEETRGATRSEGAATTDASTFTLLVPATDVPAAREAYIDAIQAFRDGSHAMSSFEKAASLDPSLAAAHLRAALLRSDRYPDEARASFERADELRARLSTRDRELLEAFRPIIQASPQDLGLASTRLSALTSAHPEDWELAYYEAGLAGQRGDIDAAERAATRALASDPEFVAAIYLQAELRAYLGHFDEARAVATRCSMLAPGSTSCFAVRVQILQQEGTCEDIERQARAWTTAHATTSTPYRWLASALFEDGAKEPAVEALLHRATELGVPSRKTTDALRDASRLATLRGDFVAAENAARAWLNAAENEPAELAHAEPSIELAQIYLETAKVGRAGAIAKEYLERRSAFTSDGRAEDVAIRSDAQPFMFDTERRAGLLSVAEYEASRARWISGWRARASPFFARYLWVHAYASFVDDEKGAREALSALSDEEVPPYRPGVRGDGRVGWTYFLAGDARGLPLLEQEARACTVLSDPFESTRAHYRLGVAREAKGDIGGACAAYGIVLARWGHGTPSSVTARDAKARSAALHCGP